jgi:Cu/Ag efflux protein CusF
MNRQHEQRHTHQHWLSGLVIACSLLWAGAPAHADHHEGGHGGTPVQASEKVNAEIRKIDLENGKVTLKHEALTQFNMGAMTMVFRVEDPSLLKSFSEGDKVRFVPAKKNGQYVVQSMEKAD